MALISTAAAVGVTFLTPRTDEVTLMRFYTRVYPMGWWRSTARLAGDDPRAPLKNLWLRLRAAGLCALSLFLMLMGLGKLFVHVPDQSILWALAFVLLGLALMPFWWRQAFVVERLVAQEPRVRTDPGRLAE